MVIRNRLTYEEFFETLKEGMPKSVWHPVRDAPIYRRIFRRLVEADVIVLKGELPELEGPTVNERLDALEKRVDLLDGGSIP